MMIFNKLIVWFMPLVPKFIVKNFSKPYVAGPELQDAVDAVRELNKQGILATLDVLGESAKEKEESEEAVEDYFQALETIRAEHLDCNISVKPTQLGLLLDKDFCYENLKRIIRKAQSYDNFVRIDMEDSKCTSDTIELFQRLQVEFKNVGIVIQAYLRRSLDDVTELVKTRTNFRICKGIYVEHRDIAYKDYEIVNNNFALLLETALKSRCYVGIATHDEKVSWHGLRLVHQLGLSHDEYEFQMLLGVDEQLRRILVDEGHRLRVYVPYGKNWYAYSMRRLKENPRIAFYIIKAILGFK
ncbi:MAG: proline dehydrogenase [Actinobacteria bacterium]|nr:proline dehydrogenase [Actinomycetota bacterium]